MRKESSIKGQFVFKTDIGKVRMNNEDQAIVLSNASGDVLMVVCDGMGGHSRGDYASRLCVDVLSEEFRKRPSFFSNFSIRAWLSRVIRKANTVVYNEANSSKEYANMGTTLVLALLHKDIIYIVNIGDSRAYSVRYAGLKQLTEDQTYVEYLVKTGKMTKEEAKVSDERHIIMNAIGSFPSVSFAIKTYPNIKAPILLCSDGLYNNVSESEIHAALNTNESIEQKVDTLIGIANSNGGSDNIAIAYWEAIE